MLTFRERLASRKLWVTVAPIVALVIAQFTGYTIDPAAIVGLAGLAGFYVLGQGYVDAKTADASIKAAADVGKLQLMAAVQQLQEQLAELGADVQSNVTPIRPEITE